MAQHKTIEAIYEKGVLRPLKPLEGVAENSRVTVTIEYEEIKSHPLLKFAGILSDTEAMKLSKLIAEEFEKVDPHAW